jgi:hypothetical protein
MLTILIQSQAPFRMELRDDFSFHEVDQVDEGNGLLELAQAVQFA